MEFMRTGCSDRCRPIWANNWNKATRTTAVACKEAQKWSWGYDDNICWPKLFIYFKRLDSWNSILGDGYLKITDFIVTQQWSQFTLHLSDKQDFAEKGCFAVCQLPFPPGDSQHWYSCCGNEMLSISSGRQAIKLGGCTWSVDVFVYVWVSSSPYFISSNTSKVYLGFLWAKRCRVNSHSVCLFFLFPLLENTVTLNVAIVGL